ncbi:hypothetical protein MHYP_G00263480 [Metynnis hypsauchen]
MEVSLSSNDEERSEMFNEPPSLRDSVFGLMSCCTACWEGSLQVSRYFPALRTSVQKKSSDSLVLDLDIPDEVAVTYNSTGAAGLSSGQICTVDGRSLQCKPEYKHRVSAALKLSAVTPSDSGVYIVKDKKNDEVLHIYTVTVDSAGGSDEVKDDHPDLDTDKGAECSAKQVLFTTCI